MRELLRMMFCSRLIEHLMATGPLLPRSHNCPFLKAL